MRPITFITLATCLLLAACASQTRPGGGWYLLKWIEQPGKRGPSTLADAADQVQFEKVGAYTEAEDAASFAQQTSIIQEGDLVAYRKSLGHATVQVLTGNINDIAYQVLRYGHLAIVVREPDDSGALRLFSSQSFEGPNTKEGLDTLKKHDWDVYRLNQWPRMNTQRLSEFVKLSREKAGKWNGYDFTGMFGLWNANLTPRKPDEIGQEYICSSVVVTALYYAGIELDAIQRGGVLDLVSPQQVVSSRGRVVDLPDLTLGVECANCSDNSRMELSELP